VEGPLLVNQQQQPSTIGPSGTASQQGEGHTTRCCWNPRLVGVSTPKQCFWFIHCCY